MAAVVSKESKFFFKPKRIRYKIPAYKKADKINQNILQYQANQKHIFRYKTLHKLYELIAFEVFKGQLKLFDWRLVKDGLVIYFEENQAEIQGTEKAPVKERIKIHMELLRQLRKGVKLRKALKIAKRKTKTIL